MWNLIVEHPTLSAIVGYYIISAAIGAMPAPQAGDSRWYLFFFKFLNTLGGNLTRAFNTAVETSPNFSAAVKLQNGSAK